MRGVPARVAPGLDQRQVELALDRLEQLEHAWCVSRAGRAAPCSALRPASLRSAVERGLDEVVVAALQDQRRGAGAGRGQVARRAEARIGMVALHAHGAAHQTLPAPGV